jgi:predicted CoA-binding protein
MASHDRARIDAFLSGKRIAFVGLSTHAEDFSRSVAKELAQHGYEIVPVHPGVDRIEERACFSRIADVPAPIDFALVMVPASHALSVVKECEAAGVRRVWLHRGAGPGAVSDEAVAYGAAHGIELVAGECPLMFLPNAGAHRAHAWMKKVEGTYPGPDAPLEPRQALRGSLFWTLGAAIPCALSLAISAYAHLVLAPLVLAGIAFVYARTNARFAPWAMAALMTAACAAIDLAVAVPLGLASSALVWSALGAAFVVAGFVGALSARGAAPKHHLRVVCPRRSARFVGRVGERRSRGPQRPEEQADVISGWSRSAAAGVLVAPDLKRSGRCPRGAQGPER